MNVEIGTEAAQLIFWEYMNPNFFAVRNFLCRRRLSLGTLHLPRHPVLVLDGSKMNNLLNLVLADFFLSEIVTKELAGLCLAQQTIYMALDGLSRTVADRDFAATFSV
jgi:hypothetical protein